MGKLINLLIGNIDEKKQWNTLQKKSKTLEHDYKVVYDGVQSYFMNFASTASSGDIINVLSEVVDMFETASSEGQDVLTLVGDDVMIFCDNLLKAITSQTWDKELREKINAKIHKGLGR